MTPTTRETASLYGAAADAAQSTADATRSSGHPHGGPMARLATELAEAWRRAALRLASFYGRGSSAGLD